MGGRGYFQIYKRSRMVQKVLFFFPEYALFEFQSISTISLPIVNIVRQSLKYLTLFHLFKVV